MISRQWREISRHFTPSYFPPENFSKMVGVLTPEYAPSVGRGATWGKIKGSYKKKFINEIFYPLFIEKFI